jgi:hypothetical protein
LLRGARKTGWAGIYHPSACAVRTDSDEGMVAAPGAGPSSAMIALGRCGAPHAHERYGIELGLLGSAFGVTLAHLVPFVE